MMSISRQLGSLVLLMSLLGAARADFYVAPNGNDANPGTALRPFQTLEKARDAVRGLGAQNRARGVTVWLAGGTYARQATFELGAADSGKPGAPVVYRAAAGQEVRLTGAKRILPEAFQPVRDATVLARLDEAARSHVVKAELKPLGLTDFGGVVPDGRRAELFFNDEPLVLARWPNEGFVRVADVLGEKPLVSHGIKGDYVGKLVYEGDRPRRWRQEPDAWLHGYWFWDWADEYQRVESIDGEKRTIALKPPYHGYGYRKGQPFYALNLLSELDAPGEWYLDRQSGTLYLWPPAPIEKASVAISVLASPLVSLRDASHVVLRDMVLEGTRGLAVEISGGSRNRIAACTIRNTGGDGARVHGGTDNAVVASDFYQIGATGISISGGDRRSLTPAGNFAANNHLHHFSRLKRTYAPALQVDGVGNRAAHNLIHDAPHMAVGFGGNENVLELNEIHDVCRETGDVGVFYTGRDWTVRGNVLRHNYIHDVRGPGLHGAQGIYLDDAASGSIVVGNVLQRVARAMLLGGGRDNIVENNLMIECEQSITFDNRGLNWMRATVEPGGLMPERLAAMPYRQSPWRERYPQLLTLLDDQPGSPKGNRVRFNVVSKSGAMGLAKEVTEFGTVADNLSTEEDLGFVDAARGDLRLRPDSPVFKKLPQFQPIPFEKIGLQIDSYRTRRPKR